MGMPSFLPRQGGLPSESSRRLPDGRFVATGTFFCFGTHGMPSEEVRRVQIDVEGPTEENRHFLVQISLIMLSAPGGDFDEDDTVFADVIRVDGVEIDGPGWRGSPFAGSMANINYNGVGVWGHHFGDLGWLDNPANYPPPQPTWVPVGRNPRNMKTSSLITVIQRAVDFRLSVTGDDWAGASYLVLEL